MIKIQFKLAIGPANGKLFLMHLNQNECLCHSEGIPKWDKILPFKTML